MLRAIFIVLSQFANQFGSFPVMKHCIRLEPPSELDKCCEFTIEEQKSEDMANKINYHMTSRLRMI